MPRIDDVQQQLQQAIDELQNQLNTRTEQIQGQLPAQREAQVQSQAQLRELITTLSVQVMQLSNQTPDGMSPSNHSLSRLPRIDFPRFEGDDVQGWVYKCEQFFDLDAIGDNRRVKIASIHLTGRALIWHQS